jgi:hypothetical protein
MSVIRFGSKQFNGTESEAYVYFDTSGLVMLYVGDTMTKEQYAGFVQRLAWRALYDGDLTINDLINREGFEELKLEGVNK